MVATEEEESLDRRARNSAAGKISTEVSTDVKMEACAECTRTEASAARGSRDVLTSDKFSRTRSTVSADVSQRAGSHSAGISCTTHELFCP
jgi:hypothetical protein